MNAVQQEFNNALMLVALQSLLTSPFYTVGKMATLGDVMDSTLVSTSESNKLSKRQ
jgi:hypothetical protein